MSKKVYCLIKAYDCEKYARAFIDTGEMYCKTLKEFKELEDGDTRGDRFEGASGWYQPEDIKIRWTVNPKIDGVPDTINIGESGLAGPTIFQPTDYDGFNLFCMYAIVIEDFEACYSTESEKKLVKERINRSIAEQTRIDPQCQNFGDYAVVILDVERFIEAVVSYARNNDMKIHRGLVGYFDPERFSGSFNGVEAIFNKRNSYKHQSEFRIAFETNNKTQQPLTIMIGLLNEFAFMGSSKHIIDNLKIAI